MTLRRSSQIFIRNKLCFIQFKDEAIAAVDGAGDFHDGAAGLADAFAGENEAGGIPLEIEEAAFFFAGGGDGELVVFGFEGGVAMAVEIVVNRGDAVAVAGDGGEKAFWQVADVNGGGFSVKNAQAADLVDGLIVGDFQHGVDEGAAADAFAADIFGLIIEAECGHFGGETDVVQRQAYASAFAGKKAAVALHGIDVAHFFETGVGFANFRARHAKAHGHFVFTGHFFVLSVFVVLTFFDEDVHDVFPVPFLCHQIFLCCWFFILIIAKAADGENS